ncbi:MAG: stage 0 sporulation family protein [bacterium]|nr:stage 0 sporulation family protein [bacterium]
MPRVVGVRFRRAGKVYYFAPGDLELAAGDRVLVETVRGVELGQVVGPARDVAEADITTPLKAVIRRATGEDLASIQDNRAKERDALRVAKEKVEARGLDMNLVDVEYGFDGGRIIFYFTADGRVDFRELVKDLAAVFRTRIELRQIGVRDEAKLLGGLGACGRELCCCSFLTDFQPVSIRMAKDQNLSLNPAKISGLCGRLMCCLRYESDHYERGRSALPEVGSRVATPEGHGKVTAVNPLRGTVTVELEGGPGARTYCAQQVQEQGNG